MVSKTIDRTPPVPARQASKSGNFRARALALVLCSSALVHAPALGQSFLGTHDVVSGSAIVTESGTTTFIDVSTAETVINWEVNNIGSSYEFQPSGTNAYFGIGSAPLTDFTVLNRILPQNGNAVIEMNGNIDSGIFSSQGGNIWFYTPGGFLIGAEARINVGSLVLTSSDIDVTNGLLGPSGEIRFQGSPAASSIVIASGAEITARADNGSSYIAMLAPRIEQRGYVEANGSIALVAAEEADLRFNAGLFDVSVSVGSADAQGIVHTGTTTGTGSDGLADVQRIAMVAVPKNDAMTMLLSGSIGYAPATFAGEDGSAVVLSAGYDLSGDTATTLSGGGPANIAISDGTFTSQVGGLAGEESRASGTITIGDTGSVVFQSAVNLRADTAIDLIANAGQSIEFTESTTLTSSNEIAGGQISLLAGPSDGMQSAGLILAFNDLNLDVSAVGTPGGPDATAGTITLTAQGGEISASNLNLLAYSSGEDGDIGGHAQGGSITLNALEEGQIDSGFTSISVEANGGFGNLIGGDAIGGQVNISADNAGLSLGTLQLLAGGYGGGSFTQAGDASSGRTSLSVTDTIMTLDGLFVAADSVGGESLDVDALTGSAIGSVDAVRITVAGTGELNVTGDLSLSADARGGHLAAQGGQVQAGGITITASDAAYIGFNQGLRASANAVVYSDQPNNFGAFTPDARGGNITVRTHGGTLETPSISLSASARGLAASGTAGSAVGGDLLLDVADGSITVTGSGFGQSLSLEAFGYGNLGPISASGQGGTARISVAGGALQVGGDVYIDVSGRFPFSFSSADPAGPVTNMGGAATVEVLSAGGSLNFTSLTLIAEGDGRITNDAGEIASWQGDGSRGVGGTASLTMAGGIIETSSVLLSTIGYGGAAPNSANPGGFTAGAGEGGTSILSMTGGTLGTGQLLIQAVGIGGSGLASPGTAATGGAGTGGEAAIEVSGANLSVSSVIELVADGLGGDGSAGGDNAGGLAGAGAGGTARAMFSGLADLSTEGISAQARGFGGVGGASVSSSSGNGGDASGGTVAVALGDTTFQLSVIDLNAGADGGSGATGGDAIGGSVAFEINDVALLADPDAAGGFPREVANVTLTAAGVAGTGDTTDGTTIGGSGSVSVSSGSESIAPLLSGSLVADLGTGAPAASGQGFSLTTGNTGFTIGQSLEITTAGTISLNAGSGAPITIGGDLDAATSGNVVGTGILAVGGSSNIAGESGIALDVVRVAGDASFIADDGAVIVAGDLDVGGDLSAQGRSVALTAINGLELGALQASDGDIAISTGQDVTFSQQTNATGAITVTSGGTVVVEAPMTATSITLGGTDVSTAGDAPLTATSGDIRIDASNSVNLGSTVDAVGALRVTAGGTVAFTDQTAADAVIVQAGGAVTVGAQMTARAISLEGADIETLGMAPLTASNGDLTLASTGNVSLGSTIDAAGDLRVTAGGTVAFTDQTAADAVNVQAGGAVTVGAQMTARTISLEGADIEMLGAAPLMASNGDIIIASTGNVSLGGAVDATGALRVTAGGTAQFAGQALASDIVVQAGDMVIGAGATLGSQARTRTIALTFTGANPVQLGGAAGANAGLSADEIGRLFAQESIDLLAGNPAQDILIDSFSFSSGAGGMIGSSGRFGVTGYGNMVVSGAIDFTTDDDASTLEFGASYIAVVTDAGSVKLHDGADTPQGQLLFTADRLFVGSSEALAAIDGLSSVSEIAAILDTPPANGTPGDAIIAGDIGGTINEALFIQNLGASDAFEDRQGFLASSFAITNGSASPIAMSINGRIRTAAATFLTGFDVAPAITQNGVPLGVASGAYQPFSTVNGCVLGQTCGGGVSLAPPRETLAVETIIGSTPTLEFQQLPITFGDMPLFETAPLVDEPVTGVGNEDLWDAERR